MSFAAEVINGALSDILCPLDNRNLNTKTLSHRRAPHSIDDERSRKLTHHVANHETKSQSQGAVPCGGADRPRFFRLKVPRSAIFPMAASKGRVRHENIMRDVKATRRMEIIQMSFA